MRSGAAVVAFIASTAALARCPQSRSHCHDRQTATQLALRHPRLVPWSRNAIASSTSRPRGCARGRIASSKSRASRSTDAESWAAGRPWSNPAGRFRRKQQRSMASLTPWWRLRQRLRLRFGRHAGYAKGGASQRTLRSSIYRLPERGSARKRSVRCDSRACSFRKLRTIRTRPYGDFSRSTVLRVKISYRTAL